MEITLMFAATTVLLAVAFIYSDIFRKRAESKRNAYRSLYEGSLDAAVRFSVEVSEARDRIETLEADLNSIAARMVNWSDRTVPPEQLVSFPEKPTPQNTDEHPVWQFAEDNSDLRTTWEMFEPGMARRPAHMRYSLWATFCGNLPELTREALETALAAHA